MSFINDTSSLVGLFARDTLECLKYIRQLKEKNVPVFFEKENINTLDAKGEVHLVAMQGVFVVHRKFTKRNSARIEFINQIVYNVVSEVRFRYGG